MPTPLIPPPLSAVAAELPQRAPKRRAQPLPAGLQALAACLLLALAAPAQAEKSDRTKPFLIESDQGAKVDLRRQLLVYTGNVVVVQGTMQLRADRIEMGKTPDDYRTASAHGTPAKAATWRQKRDGVDETVEGSADQIEFDAKSDTLKLTGRAVVRRLRGTVLADEISGATILWDNTTEVFKVDSGAAAAGAAGAGGATNPNGRVRAVLTPKAQPTAPAATPAPAPGPSAAPADLTPSRTLGDRR